MNMKVVRVADLPRMATEKGASVASNGVPLERRDMNMDALRARLQTAQAAAPADSGVERVARAVSEQQESLQAMVMMLGRMVTEMHQQAQASPRPIKAWDFEIQRDDSEFKRMTRIRATAIR